MRRMTSGELLKQRKGLRIARRYVTPHPGSSQFPLTMPNGESPFAVSRRAIISRFAA